jgi:hypothetical protein
LAGAQIGIHLDPRQLQQSAVNATVETATKAG